MEACRVYKEDEGGGENSEICVRASSRRCPKTKACSLKETIKKTSPTGQQSRAPFLKDFKDSCDGSGLNTS